MRSITTLVAVAAAIASVTAVPARAAITELGPGRYLCEAEAGRMAQRDVSDFFGGNWMAARIKLLSVAPDAGWSARAGLTFQLDGDERASVVVAAPPGHDDRLWVALDPPGETRSVQMADVRRGRTVEIIGTMTRGAVFARAGNERGQINVGDSRLTGRFITCSGGRFEIELTANPRPPRRL